LGRIRLGWFSDRKRQAKFFEDVVTELSEATNLERSTSFLYVADHKDLFLGAFLSGVDAVTAVEIVANGLISLVFEGRPHSSPLVAKYDHGIKRKYDPMFISYCVLRRNPSDFHEILAKIAAVIQEGEDDAN
jgi:hypothetical protein